MWTLETPSAGSKLVVPWGFRGSTLLITFIHLVQWPQLSWADALFNQDVKGQSMNSSAKRNRTGRLECCPGAAQVLHAHSTFNISRYHPLRASPSFMVIACKSVCVCGAGY